MHRATPARPTFWRAATAAAALLALACTDSTDSTDNSTAFDGVFVQDALGGTVSLTAATTSLSVVANLASENTQNAAAVTVTGTLNPLGGTAIALTGTYDPTGHTATVTGGGYALTGSFANTTLSGTLTAPGGGSGTFYTFPTTGATIQNYCGTFVGSGPDSGVFNAVLDATTSVILGAARSTKHPEQGSQFFSGTVSGSTATLTGTVLSQGQSVTATVTLTLSASTLTGSFSNTVGDTGTLTGAVCQ